MTRLRWPFLLIGAGLVIVMAALRLADPWPTQALRLFYFDSLQRIDPRAPADLPVRVVDIDEASLAAIGQWPWPRTVMAELVERLGANGAAVIAFDVLFAEPDRYSPARLAEDPALARVLREGLDSDTLAPFDNDAIFARTIARMPVVLGIAATPDPGGAIDYDKAGFVQIGQAPASGLIGLTATTALVPELQAAATGIGSMTVDPGGTDGIVRRVPLVWQTPAGPLPSLSIEALRVALGASTVLVHGSPDVEAITERLQIADFHVPTTDDGQIWVRYRRDDPQLYVPAIDVLDGAETVRPRIEGHIVLVGTSAAGLLDIRTTALGEAVPGVSVHAQIIEQILTGDFLQRSDLIAGTELLVFVFLGLGVTVLMSRFGPVASLATGGVAAVAVLGASYGLYARAGVLFDATFPLLGGAVNFGVLTAYQFVVADREKRMIRRSFARYVSPEVLGEIERAGHRLELGGETRDMTIMFCDIRKFTGLSESLSPTEIVTVLNDLFTRLSEAILDERGTIDKFIGDSIMAFWNAPLSMDDHPRRACLAAVRMRRALASFNGSDLMAGKPKIELAIGCATGQACVGNVGSAHRFNYSVIGDTVNVASRIEASCRPLGYPIVVSHLTGRHASDLAVLPAGRIEIRGRIERQDVDIVIGDADLAGSDAFRRLSDRHAALVAALGDASGTRAVEALVDECIAVGATIDPQLQPFYRNLVARSDDFGRVMAKAV
ncbi:MULTISPECIES: adenylate/guanylate cyclase domain-containing protein [unclassified Roseitalea]|uniref:CHASE2 domain-containing protein n=1 Tax=unclassified Roseitalea TaxID=2639107 RepID=UPI00273F1B6D|nr:MULTISPECIES: adenylate/guanylate cyclase domain-containing protein [unclassified Roseitalea]